MSHKFWHKDALILMVVSQFNLTYKTEMHPFQSASLETDRSLEHLEPLRKAVSQGSGLTTNQIAQLLGVSTSFITKNPVSFDYEGFRFVRSGRQIFWKVEYLGNKM